MVGSDVGATVVVKIAESLVCCIAIAGLGLIASDAPFSVAGWVMLGSVATLATWQSLVPVAIGVLVTR